jgi:hypothetical protein
MVLPRVAARRSPDQDDGLAAYHWDLPELKNMKTWTERLGRSRLRAFTAAHPDERKSRRFTQPPSGEFYQSHGLGVAVPRHFVPRHFPQFDGDVSEQQFQTQREVSVDNSG